MQELRYSKTLYITHYLQLFWISNWSRSQFRKIPIFTPWPAILAYYYIVSHDHKYSLFCLFVLSVQNSRKPLILVTYRNQFFSFLPKKQKRFKKQKFHTLFFNMTWSIEIKYNAICTIHIHMICITMISSIR